MTQSTFSRKTVIWGLNCISFLSLQGSSVFFRLREGSENLLTFQQPDGCIHLRIRQVLFPAGIDLFEASSCGLASSLTFPTTPGEEVWLVVAPDGFSPLLLEFNYYATLMGHEWTGTVPSEEMSWGGVKALYR